MQPSLRRGWGRASGVRARVLGAARSPIGRWVALGLGLRLLAMPVTAHNDSFWIPWMAQVVVAGHWNVYQHLYDLYGDRVLGPIVWAPYFPLYYVLLAGWLAALRGLGLADVSAWQTGYMAVVNVVAPAQWTPADVAWHIPGYNRTLLFLKTFNLPFDALLLWALLRQAPASARVAAAGLWAASPLVILSTYMIGQNDLLPAALVAAAVALLVTDAADRGQAGSGLPTTRACDLAALLIGLGAAIKYYPLLLVLPIGLASTATRGAAVRFCAIAGATFAVTILPFLGTPAFVQGALLNREAQVTAGVVPGVGIIGLSPFWLGYFGLVLAIAICQGERRTWMDARWVTLAVLGLLLGLGKWPFNWFVWVWPSVVWVAATYPRARFLAALGSASALLWSTEWGASVGAGLLTPIAIGIQGSATVKSVISAAVPWGAVLTTNNALGAMCLAACAVVALRRPVSAGPDTSATPGAIAGFAVLGIWLVAVVVVAG